MEIRFLPKMDFLKLPPLKGAVRQLPPLLLGTENTLKVRKKNNYNWKVVYMSIDYIKRVLGRLLTFLRKNFIQL